MKHYVNKLIFITFQSVFKFSMYYAELHLLAFKIIPTRF